MTSFRFKHVRIQSLAVNLPPHVVSSSEIEDRLAPFYDRLEIPFGTLERVSGVKTRAFYDSDVSPSRAVGVAAQQALEASGIPAERIGAVVSCSVTRDYFEPATASLVQRQIGVPETTLSLDVSNACLGFSNGMSFVGNLIESGVIDAGIVLSGETISRIVDASMKKILSNPEMNREHLLRILPTFTLGSGAVAAVLCHERIATTSHKLLGSVSRSAAQFNDLCVGNRDFCFYMGDDDGEPLMDTESSKLISNAAIVGQRTWSEASEWFGWSASQIDRIFCHQVGRQLGDAFFRTMGLDNSKEFSIYREFGNQVSAALPTALTLGAERLGMKEGEKVLLTGFGSGLNTVFSAIEW